MTEQLNNNKRKETAIPTSKQISDKGILPGVKNQSFLVIEDFLCAVLITFYILHLSLHRQHIGEIFIFISILQVRIIKLQLVKQTDQKDLAQRHTETQICFCRLVYCCRHQTAFLCTYSCFLPMLSLPGSQRNLLECKRSSFLPHLCLPGFLALL